MNFYKTLLDSIPGQPCLLGTHLRKQAAVLIPFVGNERADILFEMRNAKIRQGGEICFPGGMIEKNEKPEKTALRETSEELGLPENKIHIATYAGCLIASSGIIIHVFIGNLEIENTAELIPNYQEVKSIHTVPAQFFLDNKPDIYSLRTKTEAAEFPAKELGLPARYQKDWSCGKRSICVYKYDKIIIWGITATIIYEIIAFMKK